MRLIKTPRHFSGKRTAIEASIASVLAALFSLNQTLSLVGFNKTGITLWTAVSIALTVLALAAFKLSRNYRIAGDSPRVRFLNFMNALYAIPQLLVFVLAMVGFMPAQILLTPMIMAVLVVIFSELIHPSD